MSNGNTLGGGAVSLPLSGMRWEDFYSDGVKPADKGPKGTSPRFLPGSRGNVPMMSANEPLMRHLEP